VGRACPLCPDISDINLFRYCEGVIYFDAEISDRAFDLCMSEQKLDGPEVACPPVDPAGVAFAPSASGLLPGQHGHQPVRQLAKSVENDP
jgi:hypothetical protein